MSNKSRNTSDRSGIGSAVWESAKWVVPAAAGILAANEVMHGVDEFMKYIDSPHKLRSYADFLSWVGTSGVTTLIGNKLMNYVQNASSTFDTYNLLHKFKKEGYMIERTNDNRGNTCWDVYYPSIRHNISTKKNTVNMKYVGKVEKFPEGLSINKEPFFYYTWQRNLKAGINGYVKKAMEIANAMPGTTVRAQK
jgi:hypothetical protein